MNRQVSLARIVSTDYVSSVALLFPLVIWGMYLAFLFLDPGVVADFISFAGAATILGLIVLLWRVRSMQGILRDGLEEAATISGTGFWRGRGRLEYIYLHQGEKYESGNAVQKNKRTQTLQVGDQVVVLVDRNNPKRALLRDLYTEEPTDGH